MDIEFGNVNELDTNSTGWFVGFGDWISSDSSGDLNLRSIPPGVSLSDLCVKWMVHRVGDDKGFDKPISVGRTVSILVSDSGGFHLDFSKEENFLLDGTKNYSLKNHGDFVIWGADLFHRYRADVDSTILTIRWK